ncbi:MAG: hypothetical protein L6Q37_04330 [Bdellovibrionaceae bacterium]|nr:hypothetical protein [Pseudobdellovibrionaceae bacterium]NUM57494.1 hypothetical protein [Pseudobdellovibrionaceae bacterium]
MSRIAICFFLMGFYFSKISLAAIAPKEQQAKNIIKFEGAVHGGIAGSGFSLLKMNRMYFENLKLERWIVDIGDIKGKSNKGLPGYYHVQLAQNPARIIIDFNQMPISLINENELTKILKSSVYISGGRMISDPTDKNLTMILDLKKPSQLKVLQVKGQKETSKLILDLFL